MNKKKYQAKKTILKVLLLSLGAFSGNLLCASGQHAYSDYSDDGDDREYWKNDAEGWQRTTQVEPCGSIDYKINKDGAIEVSDRKLFKYVHSRRDARTRWDELSLLGKKVTFSNLPLRVQVQIAQDAAKTLKENLGKGKDGGRDISFYTSLPEDGIRMVLVQMTPEEWFSLCKEVIWQSHRYYGQGVLESYPSYILPVWRLLDDDQKGECFKDLPDNSKQEFFSSMSPEWRGKNAQYYFCTFLPRDASMLDKLVAVWNKLPNEYKTEANRAVLPEDVRERIQQ